VLEPKLKHPTIFRMFDELQPGEALTISNDHDPKPLYYQLLNERPQHFTWEYLMQGPDRWVVTIVKGDSRDNETVGEIVAGDWRKAEVFRKFGIDFCCGGKKTLTQVCQEKKVDASRILAELQRVSSESGQRALPFNDWALGFLAEYIVNTHHAYVRQALPEIRAYSRKVAMVHGEFHPELREISELVEALNEELMQHMDKEENILFPYIKQLSSKSNEPSHLGSVANPIAVMEHEHDDAGRLLERIRSLSNNYQLPPEACASYTMVYRMLEEFESDLHTHIHLENNILFPKALLLEKESSGKITLI
jgi:regulator of cell morphogenesis and NO signaling